MTVQTAGPRAATPTVGGHTRSAPRLDIQGLRAVAVIAVILDHLLAWPVGGFVGVDIFFVISGFLITGLLLKEHDRTGSISFVGFYRRRITRILPAATLALAVTVVVSFLLFNLGRAMQTLVDSIWAFFFAENWHLAVIGTDYFQADGPVSPVQHYWSLAVEEQFYLVWPWLMLLIIVIGSRLPLAKGFPVRRVIAIAMAVIVVASFAWSMLESSDDPSFAYFSTLSRAWELGLGALLAVLAPALGRLPGAVRVVMAWVGLAAIGVALFTISDQMPFPAPWAALPVIGTAAVIAAGTGAPARFLWPLTNPVSNYLGTISYSLYLWHFPVIILLGAALPGGSALFFVLAAALIFGISVASFHGVEDPIRRSRWLERIPADERRGLRWNRKQRFRAIRKPLLVYSALAVAAVWTIGFTAYGLLPLATPSTASAAVVATTTGGGGTAPALTGRDARIVAALGASSIPQLTPPVEQLGTENWVKEVNADGCAEITDSNADRCVSGPADAAIDVAVLGDSIGISWMPGLRAAAKTLGWRIHPFTMGQCPAATVNVTWTGGQVFTGCNEHRDWAVGAIGELHPDITILATATATLNRLSDHAEGATGQSELEKGTAKTLAALAGKTGKIVVLSSPPDGKALLTCATRIATPASCESKITRSWFSVQEAEQSAAKAAGAVYEDTSSWFCSADHRCPAFVGTIPVRTDGNHLTAKYSLDLAPELATMLKGLSGPAAG
ncbi:acyltransferase family protein [Leifsonia sp. NPDC080035]|uniref:Acyltransferase family protein n=1 Tax=Leifsonia sp. NPDC080035 TaxID=3143936 RepID=A0AAU7G8U1_9MICO